MKKLMTPDNLAIKFSLLLLEDIGPVALKIAVEQNKDLAYADCCASHNHCDANMVMLAAVCSYGYTEDDVFENDCDNEISRMWNKAWDIAKANHFFIKE